MNDGEVRWVGSRVPLSRTWSADYEGGGSFPYAAIALASSMILMSSKDDSRQLALAIVIIARPVSVRSCSLHWKLY